jgi:hypothetical protein
MPYIPHLNTILLQIPKSGSSSLVKAASTLGPMTHLGHIRASAYPMTASRIIAVVRDPIDRLVSAINYYYPAGDVDSVCRHILRYRTEQAAFKPQEWFMDMPGIEVYPIERISDALASIGYVDPVPRENASKKWITKADAMESRVFRRLCGQYSNLSRIA